MRPQGGRLDGQEDKAAGRSQSLARAPTQPRPHAHSPTGKKCEKQDRPAWRPAQLMSAGSEIPLQPRGEMNPAPSGLSRLGRPSIPLARCLDTANKGLYSTQSGHLRMWHCFLRLRRFVSYRPASGSAGGRAGARHGGAWGIPSPTMLTATLFLSPGAAAGLRCTRGGHLGAQRSRQGRAGTRSHLQPGYRVCPWGSLGRHLHPLSQGVFPPIRGGRTGPGLLIRRLSACTARREPSRCPSERSFTPPTSAILSVRAQPLGPSSGRPRGQRRLLLPESCLPALPPPSPTSPSRRQNQRQTHPSSATFSEPVSASVTWGPGPPS